LAKPFYRVADFDCRKSLGYLSRRFHNLITAQAEALFADAELTFTQWVTLMALRDGIADTAADIARHLGHDTGATTRMIDQMEQRGLVTRTRSAEDRRVVHLALTAQGRATAKALLPRIIDFWNEALDGFAPSDIEMLTTLLTRVVTRLEEIPAAETPKKVRA
jgi:DNA-binding MarR family transcriptional regulator